MRTTALFNRLVVFCCSLIAVVAFASDDSKKATDPFSSSALKSTMERIKGTADRFEDRFEAALDQSSLNGSGLEDQLNRWADFLKDEVDDMAGAFTDKNSKKFIDHLENAMMVATGINRAMLRREFSSLTEADWLTLRQDLNQAAMEFHRPVLPNLTVVEVALTSGQLLDRAEVKQVMEQLESSTDRFEEKFRKALLHSTAATRPRQHTFNGWARALKDASDDLLEEYKEKDPKEFSQELENTLVVADVINRLVLRSDITKEPLIEWNTVRQHLNTLAKSYGYPVLGDTIASVQQAGVR